MRVMINVPHSILLIAVTTAVTVLLRAFPFLLFGTGRQMPEGIKKAADILPPAIIAVLVIYCIKGDLFQLTAGAAASFIAIAGVVAVHLWKRNTLLSIAVGTILYMVLIRVM